METRLHLSALSFALIFALSGVSQVPLFGRAPAPAGPAALPATSATAPAKAHDEAFWQELLVRLASDDFARREEAQKELATVNYREKAQLTRLADAAPTLAAS